jgi:tRNA A37 N6-isopentenylltransferase MiaA
LNDSSDEQVMKKLFEIGIERMKISTRQYARKQYKWIQNKFLKDFQREIELNENRKLEIIQVDFEDDSKDLIMKNVETYLNNKNV